MTASFLKSYGASVFELSSGSGRNEAMEGIRGVAVLLVFLVHFETILGKDLPHGSITGLIFGFFAAVGHTGVDLFFILSGYLIYRIVIVRQTGYGSFVWRRIVRIYPAFLAVFVLYLAASAANPAQSRIPHSFPAAIVYLALNLLLLPGIFNIPAMVSVAWTLSYEAFYYLLLPAMAIVFRMRSWPPLARPAALLGLTGVYICLRTFQPGGDFSNWPVHFRLVMFAVGTLLYELERIPLAGRLPSVLNIVAMVVFPASLFFDYVINTGALRGDDARMVFVECAVIAPAFGIFVLAAVRSRGLVARALSFTALRWLGNMSYSYYLIHALTLWTLAGGIRRVAPQLLSDPLFYWFGMPLAFLTTLMTASVLFVAVEKPISLTPQKERASRRTAAAPGPPCSESATGLR